MINLLPETAKKEIKAARTNVILLRYITLSLFATVILGILVGGSYVALHNAQDTAELKVSDNKNSVRSYADVQAQANAFRADLSTARSVYDSKTSYIQLVYKIAAIVPKGVVLDSLTLDAKSFGSTATMNASAKSFDDATRLKEAFLQNKEIFSNVQFQRLQYADNTSGSSGTAYPVKVNLSVVIDKGALK